jgi:hypothetical protein
VNGSTSIITGTLGGGKTAFAVEQIVLHLASGGICYTNIECFSDKIAAKIETDFGAVFEPSRLRPLSGDLSQFHLQVERGSKDQLVMIVLDEASLDFNARDWATTSRDLLAFNNFVRKLDIRLLYITQRFEDIDKQFRARAGLLWVCRNMKHLRLWGFIPCPLPFYFRVRFDNSRGLGKPIQLDSDVTLRPWSFGLYNSDALTGKGSDIFANMGKASVTKLKRIERERVSILPELVAAFICSLTFYAF